mmetsp:Transcript_31242/g.59395  ORF Transcript_31242/g.59395 Transcript_31242/m.59395 type:complete len:785 (+) Transcript_31242:169-2523(+)
MSMIIRMRGLVIAPAIFVLLAWNAYLTYRLVAVTTWSTGGGQSSSKSDCNQVDDAPSHQPQQRRQQHRQYQQQHDEKQNNKAVPDWHRAIDCSVYDNMCFATSNTRRRYEPYPFPLGRHIKNLHEFEFDHMSLSSDSDEMPQEWTRALLEGFDDIDNNDDNDDNNDDNKRRRVSYIYPPEVLTTPLQISQCIRQSMNETWQHQIKSLLTTNRIRKESITNMVAFTISDYSYAYDMMHDVFQMNSDIVGFDGSFFMVALDESTMEMACRYGYPAVAWHTHGGDDGGDDGDGGKPDDNNISQLKRDVANTKFEVSLLLVTLGVDFFFYEMDVWFLTSPKELIADYHAQPMHDILLSSHGKDPQSVNIGLYSVASNRRTAEFFDVCLRMARESPATHDQWIVSQLLLLAWTIHRTGRPGLQLKRMWYPPPRRNPPNMEFPPVYGTYNTAEIQAGEYLLPARSTVAVHPLCRSPLKKPWGKKMVAKELGAWFGFTGRRGAGGDGGGGGYYARSGSHRRYLWMDGHDTPNAYNTVQNFEYDAMNSESLVVNHVESFRWTMATLLALARRCGRIFQMPSVTSEEGVHYLWTVLDFETVDEMGIDYRETNFPHNRVSVCVERRMRWSLTFCFLYTQSVIWSYVFSIVRSDVFWYTQHTPILSLNEEIVAFRNGILPICSTNCIGSSERCRQGGYHVRPISHHRQQQHINNDNHQSLEIQQRHGRRKSIRCMVGAAHGHTGSRLIRVAIGQSALRKCTVREKITIEIVAKSKGEELRTLRCREGDIPSVREA